MCFSEEREEWIKYAEYDPKETIMSSKNLNFLRLGVLPIVLLCGGLMLCPTGCSHKKTNRGHLFRCDWAFEYNRTPWIGCPPESGCDDERGCTVEGCKKDGCTGCKQNGFRRHCGVTSACTAKNPCCKTLGCGMWIDPTDPNSFAAIGGGIKACGLTPFCSPMKPCCLTPFCGRSVAASTPHRQTLMLGNNGVVYPGMSPMPGAMTLPTSSGTPFPTPVQPTPIQPNGVPPQRNGTQPPKPERKTPVVAGPNGLLISMGIVPGVSTVATGGIVAAAGVATPVGVMTPSGVQLPNGTVNNQVVIKACAMNPLCDASRPCGMTPGCGMLVPLAMVSNNAMMLASALNAPGVAGGVIQAGSMQAGGIPVGRVGNGTIVNPITGMPVSGLTMNGSPQMGYPPIGYTPTGYSPKYPRFDGFGMSPPGEGEGEGGEDEEEAAAQIESPITKSRMPVPRFHPVPSKPVFQRSEGMPVTPKTSTGRKVSARSEMQEFSEDASEENVLASSEGRFSKKTVDAAMERAYLEGMSDAMAEVEEELDAQAKEKDNALMQAKVLRQAKLLQAKIDARQEAELQLRQEHLARQQAWETREAQEAHEARELQAAVYAENTRSDREIRTVNYSDSQRNSTMNAPAMMNRMTPAESQTRYPVASRPQPIPQTANRAQTLQTAQAAQRAGAGGFHHQKEGGVLQSVRSLGNELVSPFAGLWSSNKAGQASPVHQAPIRRTQATPQSLAQASPPRRVSTQRSPVQAVAPYSQAICPPRPNPLSQTTQTTKRSDPDIRRAIELDAVSNASGDPLNHDTPARPPTLPPKYKTVIESDDEDSDSLSFVRQAHFVERN